MDETQHAVLTIILGGGRGTRLFPLTQYRCKPAVPLAGTYRLVDIPISNCLNAGYNRICVLTQFLTASLHRHIHASFQFDPFSGGFVEILAAEQTDHSADWYQGTADAVRLEEMVGGGSLGEAVARSHIQLLVEYLQAIRQ